jgi:hypothetical protein
MLVPYKRLFQAQVTFEKNEGKFMKGPIIKEQFERPKLIMPLFL